MTWKNGRKEKEKRNFIGAFHKEVNQESRD
jgi:hypothetical protein